MSQLLITLLLTTLPVPGADKNPTEEGLASLHTGGAASHHVQVSYVKNNAHCVLLCIYLVRPSRNMLSLCAAIFMPSSRTALTGAICCSAEQTWPLHVAARNELLCSMDGQNDELLRSVSRIEPILH